MLQRQVGRSSFSEPILRRLCRQMRVVTHWPSSSDVHHLFSTTFFKKFMKSQLGIYVFGMPCHMCIVLLCRALAYLERQKCIRWSGFWNHQLYHMIFLYATQLDETKIRMRYLRKGGVILRVRFMNLTTKVHAFGELSRIVVTGQKFKNWIFTSAID